ncbi:serotonin N-acetyltransferase 2, chloroplastic [Phalaenopsis equestris]|uniref:serotonin N-acetyltransferase 2, chloroplastic n=1 Tax=Phalaenopsis equestris TaxID=78828 RepID=UPI0009E578CB|nr:serotonin N-acetyltransferase 2, chloroplastic [Phalaenopsis equestris]
MHAQGFLLLPSTPAPFSPHIPNQSPAPPIRCTSNDNTTERTLPLSISDADLAARGIRVRRSSAGLDLEALNAVFARVGFPRREASRIRVALEHTDALVWLEEDGEGGEGVPVAFARATGDGAFNAVVWDVVVEPALQGTGLGKAVMERLLGDLRDRGIGNIALYAEPEVVGFYRMLGFAVDPAGIKGMVYSRRKNKR